MNLPTIGFAGMTHLGLVSGVSATEKGFDVICFDPDVARIGPLQQRMLPVSEPQLAALVERNEARLKFTSEGKDLAACKVIYVAPDVPTDDQGKSDLGPIDTLLERILDSVGPDCTVVVLSQVPPGFTRSRLRPDRNLYYQVETLIFGRAVERAMFPERYIVGCADPSQPLPDPFRIFLESHGCPILPMRFESAELAKISINMCLVASVSVANTLAELCERIGADWSEIVPALKLDRRIGPYSYLAPGLGIAGGNLERDLATVCNFADAHHTDAGVVRAWIANSRHRKGWAATTIKAALLDGKPDAVVAIWGLAYKENTHSTKNSPSLATIAQLPDTRLKLHDPLVPAQAAQHAQAQACANPQEAIVGVEALMILTPWDDYKKISPTTIAALMKGRIVLDPYGVLDPKAALEAGLELYSLGRPPLGMRR
jgi:UDPglucose 6-dehydrogenase